MTYRNVRQARTVDQVTARRKVQQGSHDLVLVVQGSRSTREVGTIAARVIRWWEDLRRGRLPVYGALFRFIDISIALGTPRHVLLRIPALIEWYILDRCDEHPMDVERPRLVA